jgi:myo-inositol catabolism protein IolC
MATFILAFDHRSSFVRSFLEVHGEPSTDDARVGADVKTLIADGLIAAVEEGRVARQEAGALVDATFGVAAIEQLRDAGIRVAVPVEASGRREFAFEYQDWRERLDAIDPAWAKVLVRYNPSVDAEMNERQRARLLEAQTVARAIGIGFLFELLVPPGPEQRTEDFDTATRPGLVVEALEELRGAGIEPDMWKVEGLERRADCELVGGRAGAPVVVLGRGADAAAVERWLRAGAGVPNYDGFAIGRSIWWEPARAWLDGASDRDTAVIAIAERYAHFADVWRDAS